MTDMREEKSKAFERLRRKGVVESGMSVSKLRS